MALRCIAAFLLSATTVLTNHAKGESTESMTSTSPAIDDPASVVALLEEDLKAMTEDLTFAAWDFDSNMNVATLAARAKVEVWINYWTIGQLFKAFGNY